MTYTHLLDGPPNRPNCLLSDIDFIALKMQAHPGESMIYYLRALSQYENGYVPDRVKGYDLFMSRDRVYWTNSLREYRGSKGSWTLTETGIRMADYSRELIGAPLM